VSSAEVNGRLVEWSTTGHGAAFAFGLDLATGDQRWRQQVEASWSAPLVLGSTIIQHRSHDVRTVDTMNWTTSHRVLDGLGCIAADDYVNLEWVHETGDVLVAFRGGDLDARRVIADPFRPVDALRYMLQGCGRFRDRLVLTVDTELGTDLKSASFVVVLDQAGTVLHTIALPSGSPPMSVAMLSYPKRATLAGELTRFVPYIADAGAANQLVMLDLEEGKIAWSSPEDERLVHGKLFRSGDRWHLVGIADWIADTSVAVFDGNTGRLVAAIATHNYFGVEQPGPTQVVDGRIWLHSGAETLLDEPPIAVLDATTLVPISNRTIELSDTTSTVARALTRN
jgi:hypothetical protein